MEFFSSYMHTWIFAFVPFDVIPYDQGVMYSNPTANDVEISFTGDREVVFM
jgi:hypothetical protein